MAKNEAKTKKRVTLNDIQNRTSEIFLLEDQNIVDVQAMMLISHYLPLDPIWLSLVAPSSGGKTEFINALSEIPVVYSLSTLTGKTFISGAQGAPGVETSLLFKLTNHIIAFKDLTSILNEQKDDRTAIMGQLREIYDGSYKKDFGTGRTVEWKGRITLLAGCTYSIHTLRQNYAAMGERILLYNIIQPSGEEQAIRAMENQESGKFKEDREGLAHLWAEWHADMTEKLMEKTMTEDGKELLVLKDKLPTTGPEMKKGLAELAEFSTRARSEVERDWRSATKEMTEAHDPEMPGRMSSQLMNASLSFMLLTKLETGTFKLTDKHKKIVETIALDSITKIKRKALTWLAKYDVIHTSGLAVKMGFPTATVRRCLEDLAALNVIHREKGGGSKGDNWIIVEKYRKLMTKYLHVKHEGGRLEEVTDEEDTEGLQAEAEEILAEEAINEEAQKARQEGFDEI